jgi:hypothetical protein
MSYCSRGVSGDGQSALVVKSRVSPSQYRLLTGSHRYHPGIVQQAQGRSADTAGSPHHKNQSTNLLQLLLLLLDWLIDFDGWDYVSELLSLTDILIIPQMINKYRERRWNNIDRGKAKNSEKNLSQCHFVYHESRLLNWGPKCVSNCLKMSEQLLMINYLVPFSHMKPKLV